MVQKQNIEFTAKDDVILRGWLFVPDGPGRDPRPGLDARISKRGSLAPTVLTPRLLARASSMQAP